METKDVRNVFTSLSFTNDQYDVVRRTQSFPMEKLHCPSNVRDLTTVYMAFLSAWNLMIRLQASRQCQPCCHSVTANHHKCVFTDGVRKVNCQLVQALRLFTSRTVHRGSRGIAILFLDRGTGRE